MQTSLQTAPDSSNYAALLLAAKNYTQNYTQSRSMQNTPAILQNALDILRERVPELPRFEDRIDLDCLCFALAAADEDAGGGSESPPPAEAGRDAAVAAGLDG